MGICLLEHTLVQRICGNGDLSVGTDIGTGDLSDGITLVLWICVLEHTLVMGICLLEQTLELGICLLEHILVHWSVGTDIGLVIGLLDQRTNWQDTITVSSLGIRVRS